MSQEQRLPEPYYEDSGITIFCAKNENILPLLAAESFHAVVTDPPYDLTAVKRKGSPQLPTKGFMGQQWDGTGIAFDPGFWRLVEVLLKPGAHLLSFGGTRTHHRMVCAIEDASFEIRDTLGWVFASGFPKSLSVSKAIDHKLGAKRERIGRKDELGAIHSIGRANQTIHEGWRRPWIDNPNAEAHYVSLPATDAAKQWDGWGSALKPAWESICLARKPLTGTICENILEHGCGALNIDASRIPGEMNGTWGAKQESSIGYGGTDPSGYRTQKPIARYPSNLIHDGSDEVLAEFDKAGERAGGAYPAQRTPNTIYGGGRGTSLEQVGGPHSMNDTGSAARFFFCAKSSRAEREENLGDLTPATGTTRRNTHSTVKPLKLMQYLCRLICPPGGIILDPFCGSGSTLVAAQSLGFRCIGIEQDEAFCEIAARRLRQRILPFSSPQREEKQPVTPTPQPMLFTDT